MKYDHECRVALEAAQQAGDYLVKEYQRFQAIPDAPASITTEADKASQEIILKHLCAAFPEDAFCAEEDTPTLASAKRSGPRIWIIDPIDGTRGFARKNGEFSVMISLVEEGRIVVGAVLEPAKERLTYAVRGEGCRRQDGAAGQIERCTVSATDQISATTLTQSHSKNPDTPSAPVRALSPHRVIESYSAGIKLALVARGEADLYVNTYPAFSDWDICAGNILVEEAGGKVTGLKGETLQYEGKAKTQRFGLLATNGKIHEQAVGKLREMSG